LYRGDGVNAGVERGATGERVRGVEAGFERSKFANTPLANRKNQPYKAVNGFDPDVPGSGNARTAAESTMAPTAPEKGWVSQPWISNVAREAIKM
jgi:hypothetical protein